MTKIKVSNLQPGPQMDALVAEAQEWEAVMLGGTPVWCSKKGFAYHFGELFRVSDYHPSTNGGQCFELIKEFNLSLIKTPHSWQCDYKQSSSYEGLGTIVWTRYQFSETPEIAICRAVIASKFGEYVEVSDD